MFANLRVTVAAAQVFRVSGCINECAPTRVSDLRGWSDSFLASRDPDVWPTPADFPSLLSPEGLFFQRYDGRVVSYGLEVVLVAANQKPTAGVVRDGYAKRRGGRASPVLLVVGYPSAGSGLAHASSTSGVGAATRLAVCGPLGDNPAVTWDLDIADVERIADCALAEPDQHAAVRMLQKVLVGFDAPAHAQLALGMRNVGLLATQELREGVPRRADWDEAVRLGQRSLALRGRSLVESLGFTVEQRTGNVHLLRVNGHARAAAVFCQDHEPFDAPARRFDGMTPVSLALSRADEWDADWVVLTRGSELRLYAARPDTGVGRKGRTETFVEANLALLTAQSAGYLHLLFSAQALDEGGTVEEVLESSERFAAELAVRLRDRIYDATVPALAAAVARRIGAQPSLG